MVAPGVCRCYSSLVDWTFWLRVWSNDTATDLARVIVGAPLTLFDFRLAFVAVGEALLHLCCVDFICSVTVGWLETSLADRSSR